MKFQIEVVCPLLFEYENVNSENYRNILIHYAFPRIGSLREGYFFQQNCANVDYFSCVKKFRTIRGTIIGLKKKPVQWPAPSLDLAHNDVPLVSFERKRMRCFGKLCKASEEQNLTAIQAHHTRSSKKLKENVQLCLNVV